MLDGVFVSGIDVTDSGVEFRPGEPVRDLQVVVTNRTAALNGTVIDERGAPAAGAVIVVLPEHATASVPWAPGGLTTETDDTGRFALSPMRSGEYRVAAVRRLPGVDPRTLETLRPLGVLVPIDGDEEEDGHVDALARLSGSRSGPGVNSRPPRPTGPGVHAEAVSV